MGKRCRKKGQIDFFKLFTVSEHMIHLVCLVILLFNQLIVILLAQLWKINENGKLENKLRKWLYNDKITTIPELGEEGKIEIKDINKVFAVANQSHEVEFKPSSQLIGKKHMWKVSRPNIEGWSKIVNIDTDLFLTAKQVGKLKALQVENECKFILQIGITES